MPYLLVVYGATFVAGGFALALQARTMGGTQPLPRVALALLAGFALVHGASEWTSMAMAFDARIRLRPSDELVVGGLLLLALSFGLLFAFGATLLVRYERRLSRAVLAGLIPPVVFVVVVSRLIATAGPPAESRASVEAMVRYILGIPACLTAALGLFTMRRHLASEERRTLQYVALAAGVFLCYGVLAGVVVPRAPFAPASLMNAAAFEENVHLPVEALRAVCAVAIVVFMSEAFVVEPFDRLERELAEARADLRTLLVHDLGAPLAVIDRASGEIEGMLPADPAADRQRGMLRSIRGALGAVRERIRDLLDASDLEAHRLLLVLEPVDLRPVLSRAVDEPSLRDGTVRARLESPDDLAPVLADPARVEQVLRKLLRRAREHASSSIVLAAEQEPDEVAISVTAEGASMPSYDVPYVFARAGRRAAANRDDPRSRLELHLARGLIEEMGGEISVESAPAGALTFRFTLPLARVAKTK